MDALARTDEPPVTLLLLRCSEQSRKPGERCRDLTAVRDIGIMFGDGFADQIVRTAPGTWSGPVESSYGLHLVLVSERIEGSLPDLAAVRPAVERDYVTARRKQQLDTIYESLLEKFSVVIEGSAGETLTPKTRKGGL